MKLSRYSRLWRSLPGHVLHPTESGRPSKFLSNLRLLLSRFELVGKEHSPCGSRSRSTSIAAQQNR